MFLGPEHEIEKHYEMALNLARVASYILCGEDDREEVKVPDRGDRVGYGNAAVGETLESAAWKLQAGSAQPPRVTL